MVFAGTPGNSRQLFHPAVAVFAGTSCRWHGSSTFLTMKRAKHRRRVDWKQQTPSPHWLSASKQRYTIAALVQLSLTVINWCNTISRVPLRLVTGALLRSHARLKLQRGNRRGESPLNRHLEIDYRGFSNLIRELLISIKRENYWLTVVIRFIYRIWRMLRKCLKDYGSFMCKKCNMYVRLYEWNTSFCTLEEIVYEKV